jgi:hypothetical protein
LCVVILSEVSIASLICHPDEASDASGRKDLGQLRDSEAGTGSEIAQRSTLFVLTVRALRTMRGT